MIRYLLILFTGAIMLLAISLAWSKTAPPVLPEQGQETQADTPAQDETPAKEKPAVRNPFKRPDQDADQKKSAPEEKNITLNKMPQLSLKGILKMKGGEPVGLLVVEALKGVEIFRVRKGDTISITLAGEDVLLPSDLEPEPPPPAANGTKNGKNGTKKKQTDNSGKTQGDAGEAPAPKKPKVKLKEIQVELKIMEISMDGLDIQALPLSERILVR